MNGQGAVVLVGAGHAHLYVASRTGAFARAGIQLMLIDPGNFWYSPAWLRKWELPVDDKGGLYVNKFLQVIGQKDIFGAGDCIALEGHELPKLGVFGVREAPILTHNLLATITGRPLKAYHPQKRYLAILNLGLDQGLATWGPLYWQGRASLWLKDRIDRRFLERYKG